MQVGVEMQFSTWVRSMVLGPNVWLNCMSGLSWTLKVLHGSKPKIISKDDEDGYCYCVKLFVPKQ
jgi:hypothetical protein